MVFSVFCHMIRINESIWSCLARIRALAPLISEQGHLRSWLCRFLYGALNDDATSLATLATQFMAFEAMLRLNNRNTVARWTCTQLGLNMLIFLDYTVEYCMHAI